MRIFLYVFISRRLIDYQIGIPLLVKSGCRIIILIPLRCFGEFYLLDIRAVLFHVNNHIFSIGSHAALLVIIIMSGKEIDPSLAIGQSADIIRKHPCVLHRYNGFPVYLILDRVIFLLVSCTASFGRTAGRHRKRQ